jgi:hypothetical protein
MNWQPIETLQAQTLKEMFIWAQPKDDGKWSLGLGYRTVSGTWADIYGGDAPKYATHWMSLPEPPNAPHDGKVQPQDNNLGTNQ